MAIDFPSNPNVNDTYTFNGRTWKWNGVGWVAQTGGTVGPPGPTGPQGPPGDAADMDGGNF